MSFIVDKQSLEDLNLIRKDNPNSMLSLYNQVKTLGGEKLLETIFNTPLSDPGKINKRSAIFQYFQQQNLKFPFSKEMVDMSEKYLNEGHDDSFLRSTIRLLKFKSLDIAVHSEEYERLINGVKTTIDLLEDLSQYLLQLNDAVNHPYKSEIGKLKQVFKDQRLVNLLKENSLMKGNSDGDNNSIPFFRINRYHFLLTSTLQEELKFVFKALYELDVYVAVSGVARAKGMGYAKALPASASCLNAKGLRHPALDKAISNSISLSRDENVLFLTGANMAGKSTWMKTIGLSMYIAHLGFPIAADSFEFSIFEGIYSSINIPDNLNMGYSHFYAEVLRVKDVALQVSAGKNLLVLFDELFKGTNVKDAYDATLAVSQAFSGYTNCLFVISTHINEVGEALGERCENIQFRYLPTVMEGSVPKYTYQLKEGIANDRQGMMIIENERILEIIEGREAS
ncbi:MutS-related protein [Solitalea lacus]|uniref:MutS-related protein n=1 Tax=Solitalea lacus TaxID=2911172 RepID=UPI001EDB202D|nr:DNA mismatch repair protein [Solitalea lacus]UKJ06759.1 DNA mismatch repair protein [Solitalea lacus]